MSFTPLLLPEDIISRSIIEPTHIDSFSNILKLETFAFPDNRPESVNCHRFFENSDDAHQLGRKLASGLNKRQEDRGKPPNKIYRGYIESTMGKISSIKVENAYFHVEHYPENNNHAHCNIHLETTDNLKPMRSIKEMIRHKLLKTFSDLRQNPMSQDDFCTW